MTPVFISSDHSFEHGGSTIKEYVESALDKGIKRLCLVDTDTMAGSIGFVEQCSKAGIEHTLGFRASVYHPIVSNEVWLQKNQFMISKIIDIVNFPVDFETHSDNWILIIDALLSYHTSKAKTKHEILLSKINDIVVVDTSELTITPAAIKSLRPFIAKFNREKPTFFIIMIAKNERGYKRLLRLSTSQSEKWMLGEDSLDPAERELTIENILYDSDDLVFVDALEKDSLLGVLYHNELDVPEGLLSLYQKNNFNVGVRTSPNKDEIYFIKKIGLPSIPFSFARFSESYGYDDFCVKYSILTKKPLKSLSFSTPVRPDDYMYDHAFVEKDIAKTSKKIGDIYNIGYWENFQPTHVTLNKVVLPNCDIPEDEVSEYACRLLQLNGEGKEFFEAWVESSLPDNKSLSEHRRSRFESYYMHKLSYEGSMRKLKLDFPDDYESRIEEYTERHLTEFEIIDDMGFAGYFLIMHDIVSYARKIGVPVGEARGSAAGSLIVYGLDITDVDPIFYGLQFERFLNPERVSMPDIDVDFGHGGTVGRDDVLEYVRKKYSSDKYPFTSVSQISNTNRFMLKKALAAACEAYSLPQPYKKYVANLVKEAESEYGIKAPEVITWEDLLKYEVVAEKLKQEPVLYRVIQKAQGLFKKKETCGVHAGGLVISPTMVPDYSALTCDKDGNFISEFDKDDIETAGLIKFDILGLENLSVLAEANMLVEKRDGQKIDIRNIPKNDEKVFALINQNITLGVFQIESPGMKSLVTQLQPKDIGEIAVLSALFRPGALQSGMVEDFVDTKHGRKPLTYDHPAMEIATKDTYGCIVYQEQVMSIVRLLAGYSLGEADQLRRAMGKKKIEEMTRLKTDFTRRAQAFWRSDYITKGKSRFELFELDLNLLDVNNRFECLQLDNFITEGYFSEVGKVEEYLKSLLGLNKDSSVQLHNRLSDINYTVKVFKDDYQKGIFVGLASLMESASDAEIDEVQTRVYFALTQWVRFNSIFNKIEKFAGYGFNKSHAIGYSLITYSTAYFKTNYPPEFYAATMSFSDLKKIDPLAKEAMSKMHVSVLKPSINKSLARFTTEGKSSVRYGLSKLTGVATAGLAIESARDDAPFVSIYDFICRYKESAGKKITSPVVHSLAMTGAFDEFIPQSIAKNINVNGRLFVAELILHLKDTVLVSDADKGTPDGHEFHRSLKDMSINEVLSYLLTAMGGGAKKIAKWVAVDSIGDEVKTTDDGLLKDVIDEFLVTLAITLKKPNATTIQNDKSLFKIHYDKVLKLIGSIEVEEYLVSLLEKSFVMSLVDTVNEEKKICGMYLTMSPLDAIDAFNRVEREPPSSMADGCPIRLSDVDKDVDGESIMTLGVVRDVNPRQVMNPESDYFTQKILEFHLEDGLDLVKFSIFGTRPVDKLSEYIVDGAIIMAVGKVKYSEKYGLSVGLEAFKRYHPEEDENLIRVPKVKRF